MEVRRTRACGHQERINVDDPYMVVESGHTNVVGYLFAHVPQSGDSGLHIFIKPRTNTLAPLGT